MKTIKTKIIKTLKDWNTDLHSDFEAIWKGYKQLSVETKTDVKTLRKAIKELSDEGKIELLHTACCESRVSGSGWFLVDI